MTTTQIYTLVNAVNSEAFGAQSLSVQDPAGLISLGTAVLSSSGAALPSVPAVIQT